jgi:pimeloyl-ACP methyl ester carboxylesterase
MNRHQTARSVPSEISEEILVERIASPVRGKFLKVIHRPSAGGSGRSAPVLYVHGATFPATLAVGWRFDSRSWMDQLADEGFDVWAFDFLGYGGSDRYDEMNLAPDAGGPLGQNPLAAQQVENVIRHVLARTGAERIHIVAHSWGTQPAAKFAGDFPNLVDHLVLFAPILQRDANGAGPRPGPLPAFNLVTIDAQWKRFTEDVPANHPPVLLERHFKPWSQAYLDTDFESRTRSPPAVKIPMGPLADAAAAWSGRLSYEAAAVKAPTFLVRGEWDSACDDRDAAWFAANFTGAKFRQHVKIARGTHLMHVEESRFELWRVTSDFLCLAV